MNSSNTIVALILAAGKGKRMRSKRPKVLHEICGAPLLSHVLNTVLNTSINKVYAVVGYGKDEVISSFKDRDIVWIEQKELLGTGDAVRQATPFLNKFDGVILVLAGDMPLIRSETLATMCRKMTEDNLDALILTSITEQPEGMGRILRTHEGRIIGIIEEKDASSEELNIREINTSVYAFKAASLLDCLPGIVPMNAQREYYLTDVISIMVKEERRVNTLLIPWEEALGINSPTELMYADGVLQKRIKSHWLENGVTLIAPHTIYIEAGAIIGQESIIYPFCWICRDSRIGSGCKIGPFVHIDKGVSIPDGSLIRGEGNFLHP